MTFHDAVEALSQCIRYSAELVETTRLNCRLVVQSRQYNTFRKCKDFAKRIDKCRDRLLSSKQEVEELPDEYSNLICLTSPLHFNPFIWRGIPWSPVASAVEYIAEDLINDSLEFEAWNDPDEDIDEAHRLETCEWLLEKWPEDLHQRLLILRSHFEHEAGQIPIDISTQSTTALPGYLGLVVDKTNRRVRRVGYESTADIQFPMMPESSDQNHVQPSGSHEEDGPAQKGIKLNGIVYSLTPRALRIVKLCWTQEDKSIPILEASDDHAIEMTLDQAKARQKDFNRAVVGSGWEMSLEKERFTIRKIQ